MIPAGGCSLDETGGPWEAVGWVVEQLERAWLPVELYSDPICHGYIPLRLDQFVEALLMAVKIAPGKRFLEIGCGIGTKLMLASRLGLDVTGIENREHDAAIAKYLCPEANVVVADARWFDGYGAFDIVYSYRPLRDEAAERAFEARLYAATGAVLILPAAVTEPPGRTPRDQHRMVWA